MSTSGPLPRSSRLPGRPGRWDESRAGLELVAGVLGLMWLLWVVNSLDSYRLDHSAGIEPRNVDHLWAIFTAPFLHASFGHIFGNSIPFLILGGVVALAGVGRFLAVSLVALVISGLGVWLTAGSGSDTVGASGVIFGFAAYLVARGLVTRRVVDLLVGVVVGALFGLSLLSDLIPRSGISWQAHLFGALGGALAAWLLSAGERRHPAGPGPTLRRP